MKSQLIFIKILILFIVFTVRGNSQGFLHTDGKKIVKGDGTEILLRGIGLGGWLVPEGYMLQTSGFANSPTEIRNKIYSLIGEPGTSQFYQAYRDSYVRRKDIDKIKEWGFNSIRLPLHYTLFTPKNQPGVYIEEGFAIIDTVLKWCEANSLYLILDLHCAPGGQNNINISDYIPGEPSLWESTQNQTRTVDLWKKIAERYVSKEWIGGYDLINETNWDLGPLNAALRELSINITSAIRTVDQNHIVFIEGNWYATGFNGLTPPWDNNMVYSFHKYWNSTDLSSISGYLNIRNTYNVPLWLGESGENSNQWFVDCIEMLEANNIGWSWWTHKKIESIAVILSATKTPQYDVLLKYWNNQGPKPTVQYATDALIGQAAKLNIDGCTFRKDFIDALFRQKNNITSVPFTQNDLPGLVFASNYDMGKNSYAYKDIDYQNTGNNGVYNSGYEFRNDGVDIEKCSDVYSNGYDVGWTNTGEFLTFTVNVATSGRYSITGRTASNQAGGKIVLKWDDQNLSEAVPIPVTGGWQTWGDVSFGEYQLTAGIHKFGANFFFGGFNLNFFEFTLIATGLNETSGKKQSFEVYQNYPNPFSHSNQLSGKSTIGYYIPKEGRVQIKLFNTLGSNIAILFDEIQPEGNKSVQIDAKNLGLTSGTYFYEVTFDGFDKKIMKAVYIK